jgi:site-specific recombinase XerD
VNKPKRKLPRGVYEKVPGSGIYWIWYAGAAGEIHREKVGPSIKRAVQLYQKRKTEVLQGIKLPETLRKRRVKFSELVEDALAYSKTHKRSYRHDVCRAGILEEEFGSRDASSITHQGLNTFLQERGDEEEWENATYNRYRALLSLIFRLGIENQKVTANPAKLLKHRLESAGRVRWLTTEEECALVEVLHSRPEWAKRLPDVVIALNTGMRLSEQFDLDWSRVNLDLRVVWIPRSKHGGGRHVRLNEHTLAAFRELLELNGGRQSGRVFCDITITDQKRHEWFNEAVAQAGIKDFHWHDLRHTFASRLVMSGVPLRTVQELMGHKSIQMTCRYAHLAPAFEQEAVDTMGREWAAKVEEAKAKQARSSAA